MINKTSKILLLGLASVFSIGGLFAKSTARQSLNEGWVFEKDGKSRVLNLPHDWGVEYPFEQIYPGETGKLPWWGKAKYSKVLTVDATEQADSLRFLLDVDGAMSGAKVYVNDDFVMEWPYGYASFRADLTPYLNVGDNNLVITLDNPENSSRWYPGGGIYRNVWLTKELPVSVGQWGTYITSDYKGNGDAEVNLEITLDNKSKPYAGEVITEIFDNGKIIDKATTAEYIQDGTIINQKFNLKNVELWSPESPKMYLAKTTVVNPDGKVSVYETPFGIRTIEFKPDGFYLNGEKNFLKGVCLHHDAGALGAVWNNDAWVRRLNLLKEMGCNAIRTSHNPPAPEFLELCDSLGFMVEDEFTDSWTLPLNKKPNGYVSLFEDWSEKDVKAMIIRDRNHPSVVLWSIGNECEEQLDPTTWWVPLQLYDITKQTDPTRPVTSGNNKLPAYKTAYHLVNDVYGFNYKPFAYEDFHKRYPNQPVIGAETASCVSTRGYYKFPVEEDKGKGWVDGAPYQVSSYDLYAPGWASKPDYEWEFEDKAPYLCGEFVWTGIDYLGEPTPYNVDWSILTNFTSPEEKAKAEEALRQQAQTPPPARSSYFGIIDLAGFPKDRYYLYQSRWNPEKPMAHILPHWNWEGREGDITPIHVYTSGDSAELFVNGESKGLKKKGEYEYRLRWDDVVYEPGIVEVVAYKDGKEWARDKVETTGKAEKLVLSKDYEGKDLTYVRVEVADKQGQMVPTANNDLKFSISGPGKIVACDGGDPTSHIPFYSTELPAFNGLSSVIVERTGPGKITLKATSKGLKSGEIKI
ncbi:MAG: DUF4982 domain-containing protein [Muribaculaceae bacterium]|nr:DUF4982 domain-containing protein [Muribaculaceae bacterium]